MTINNKPAKNINELLEKQSSSSMRQERERITCSIILTKGRRKNLPCNRKVLEGTSLFCKFHTVKIEPIVYCTVILTKGERKNQTCNRKSVNPKNKMCKIHMTLEEKRPYNPYNDNEDNISLIDNFLVSKMGKLDIRFLEPTVIEKYNRYKLLEI